MQTYDWILFDADDTLFHWDAFFGLQLMFERFNIQFTAEDYAEYQVINKLLWSQYQQGEISVDQVKQDRFQSWAKKLQLAPAELNTAFIDKMADISAPIEGVVPLLNELQGRVKLGIITNGFTQLQEIRLARTGLSSYFNVLVISEQVGFAKPHQAIFEEALYKMGNPLRKSVLMVGDNPETDILGGIHAGLDTCWLNVNKTKTSHIKPRYEITHLMELKDIVFENS